LYFGILRGRLDKPCLSDFRCAAPPTPLDSRLARGHMIANAITRKGWCRMTLNMDSLEVLEVAVAVVEHKGLFLLEFNRNWKAFGFPMTKKNDWEKPAFAAARAASEVLGIPVVRKSGREPHRLPGIQQSQRVEESKEKEKGRYVNKIYTLVSFTPFERLSELVGSSVAHRVWLSADEIFGGDILPIASSMSLFHQPLTEVLQWIK